MTTSTFIKKRKVLCIDDSRLNRAFISKTLTPINIEVDTAVDGIEGLDKIKSEKYDLILVDIVMPKMNGFEFLKEFQILKKDEFIPVILMTGLDDMDSKIKGLNIGADDYLLKPINELELIARVMSLLRLKDANQQLSIKNKQIQRELEAAKKIQQFIIPSDFSYIEYPKVSGIYKPIEDIGGDFFDCIKIDDEKTAFVIADVTGHGIPAALTMTMSKMLFSIYADKFDSSSSVMKEINRQLRGSLLDTQYITSFFLIYDHKKRKLNFTNAGHNRALYFRAEENQVIALDTFGLFLGISDDVEYEEKKISVKSGDRLLIYTDGITEAKNIDKDEFGEKRLGNFIRRNNALRGMEFCKNLMTTITDFNYLQKLNDDVAFLNIEF